MDEKTSEKIKLYMFSFFSSAYSKIEFPRFVHSFSVQIVCIVCLVVSLLLLQYAYYRNFCSPENLCFWLPVEKSTTSQLYSTVLSCTHFPSFNIESNQTFRIPLLRAWILFRRSSNSEERLVLLTSCYVVVDQHMT